MLVEYENGAAAYASADSDAVYVSGSAADALQTIMATVVGPVVSNLP